MRNLVSLKCEEAGYSLILDNPLTAAEWLKRHYDGNFGGEIIWESLAGEGRVHQGLIAQTIRNMVVRDLVPITLKIKLDVWTINSHELVEYLDLV